MVGMGTRGPAAPPTYKNLGPPIYACHAHCCPPAPAYSALARRVGVNGWCESILPDGGLPFPPSLASSGPPQPPFRPRPSHAGWGSTAGASRCCRTAARRSTSSPPACGARRTWTGAPGLKWAAGVPQACSCVALLVGCWGGHDVRGPFTQGHGSGRLDGAVQATVLNHRVRIEYNIIQDVLGCGSREGSLPRGDIPLLARRQCERPAAHVRLFL
jgi:hypothetical protein